MTDTSDRLYKLLPAIYRIRDDEYANPLRALLGVIEEQVDTVEANIAQTYENWFIETCEDWVVSYIGDLIGYTVLRPDSRNYSGARTRVVIPRRDVANVIRYRRRKGTLALLELLARDAANLPARAVEFYKRLAVNQSINFLRSGRGRSVNMRDGNGLDLVGGPFDMTARTYEVRRALSGRTTGRYNIPAVGVFVWRLSSYSVTETPAYCVEDEAPECYTFSVLGNDTHLYNDPRPEPEPTHIAGELDLPTPIRRRALEKRVFDRHGNIERTEASEDYYPRSLAIYLLAKNGEMTPVPRELIIPADLSDWGRYRPHRDHVAVDPRLGRIIFAPNRKPRHGVVVSYRYAFSADMGGGEYHRTLSQPKGSVIYRIGKNEELKTIGEALNAWNNDEEKPDSAVIEIHDSGVYTEPLRIDLGAEKSLQIRAASRRRPVIRLLDYQASLPDGLTVKGQAGSRFTLDGLLIAGRSVRIDGAESIVEEEPRGKHAEPHSSSTVDLCEVTIRHCTLVPGWGVQGDCKPQRPNEPSLELESTNARIKVEHSIVGTIVVHANERASEPLELRITDSILDATKKDRLALGSHEGGLAYARLTIERTTVIGTVKTHAVDLAENTIFNGFVTAGRRQQGCVRFCYVPYGSRTPRRFQCQPDLAEQKAETYLRDEASKLTLPPPAEPEITLARESERVRVVPAFNSTRYGTATYCQLANASAREITEGADDTSEMGAFHDLYMPQRLANLRTRLDEFSPAGSEVGIIIAS